MPDYTPQDVSRFWKYVAIGAPDECWEWQGVRRPAGYGKFKTIATGYIDSHRFSWMLVNGEIPAGRFICHACDNPPCVNPAHLWLGDRLSNAADMVRKGRQATGLRLHRERMPRGEKHYARLHPEKVKRGEVIWTAKLTEDLVREIRAVYVSSNITMTELSRRYGVTRTMIGYIVNRKSWKHVA